MAYVITQACLGAKYTHCVDVCPVDAFREGAEMLYIDPDVCIDCNACLTECPARAIYPAASVPDEMQEYIAINAVESKRHPVITERKQEISASENAKDALYASSDERVRRFAVVGAGPSGFFTAEALLKQFPESRIDLIEKLPTPFGLVRYGVAPDHPAIKTVSDNFSALIRKNPQIHFFGNVEIGKDITRDELLTAYDYIIYTTGGSLSKKLDLPGFTKPGVYGASAFVGWYNGHPEHKALAPNLDVDSLAIIGMGNVALDIARILCLPNERLQSTDIADHALTALAGSKIREINLIERRGAAQASFTPKELQQLIELKGINLVVDAADLDLDPAIEQFLEQPENSEAKQNVALLRSLLSRKTNGRKTIRFVFNSSTESIEGDGDNITALITARSQVYLDSDNRFKPKPTPEKQRINAKIIINSTGYQGRAIEGLQFDARRGIIANRAGRALLETGHVSEKEYVAGWIKRGASGVIGTNKQCAANTVKQLVKDSQQAPLKQSDAPELTIEQILNRNHVTYFDFSDWQTLDDYERQRGQAEDRPRRKVVDIDEMLKVRAKNQSKTSTQTPAPDVAKFSIKTYDASQPVKTHYRTCSLCEAMCGIKVEYQGERIVSIAGDEKDQHSRGHICPKGYALQDLHNDPERLKTPLKRIGDQWISIDWEEAFDEVAERIFHIQKAHGKDSVAAYWGNPGAHNLGILLTTPRFRKALGTRNLYSSSSLDQMPHQLTSYLMYGHSLLFTIPDIDRTDYMLMLGANPAVSNGSLMSAGDVLGRLQDIIHRGGKLVLIDPRKTETALYASEHVFIRPGTDALFLLGLIQVIMNKGLSKPSGYLPLRDSLDEIRPLANAIPLQSIAEITRIPKKAIERIAVEFAKAERAVCYGRMGVSTQEFGALNHWLIQILNIITGNLDQPGGMMFTTPAVDILNASNRGGFNRYRSRVRNLPEFSSEFPAATLADEMLTPGKGQIKAFVCVAGNPVLSSPNGTKLEKGLKQLDFMVSIDLYLNETSRYADIILPPTGPFEHEQYDAVFNMFSVRNVAKFAGPLFKQKSYMRSDAEIFSTLAALLMERKAQNDKLAQLKLGGEELLNQYLTLEKAIDLAIRQGPYGGGLKSYLNPFADTTEKALDLGLKLVPYGNEIKTRVKALVGAGLTLDRVREHVHGIDLGPLQSCLPQRLFTKDQKIHLLPEPMLADLNRLQARFGKGRNGASLVLISRRDLRTNNSWMHNSLRLVKGTNRCALLIHPETAHRYGLSQGEEIYLHSEVGKIKVTAALTEDMMPNVVCLPHGWGHHRAGMKISTASAHPGISINDITSDALIDPLSGNAVLNGVPVAIEKIDARRKVTELRHHQERSAVKA